MFEWWKFEGVGRGSLHILLPAGYPIHPDIKKHMTQLPIPDDMRAELEGLAEELKPWMKRGPED
jgi:hypothetical protein